MIDWLLETSLAVTALMLLVLAVRRPVAHFFGAGWAYALWLLPVLRLVLPPCHLFGDAIPSLLAAAPAAIHQGAATASTVPAATAIPLDWEPLLLALWLAGSAAFILWQSASYIAFMRRLGIGSQVHASLAQDVGIIESAEVDGPLAIGLLDRWIVVPADFAIRYTPQEQQLALRHERIHHQREDIFWNMVALAVLALNWFNPVAYLAFRAFRTDQELSCDAAVAAGASGEERRDYAFALVKSASRPGLIAACPLNHAGQLKQRLRMMKAHRRSPLRTFGGSAAAAVLALAGLSVTQTASVAAAEPAPFARPVPPAPRVVPAPVQKPEAPAARLTAAQAQLPTKAPARPRGQPKPVKIAAAVPAEEAPPLTPALPGAPAAEPAGPHTIVVRIDNPRRSALSVRALPSGRAFHVVSADGGHGPRMTVHLEERLEALLARRAPSSTPPKLHIIHFTQVREN